MALFADGSLYQQVVHRFCGELFSAVNFTAAVAMLIRFLPPVVDHFPGNK
jgi:hypothetical protein